MKKLFLFLPALLLSLLANAAVININNSTPNTVQAALNSAASGDEIVMAAGIYEEVIILHLQARSLQFVQLKVLKLLLKLFALFV